MIVSKGHFGEAMTDLTGEGCESFDISNLGDKEEFWKKLVYFDEEQFLMGCSVPLGANVETETDNGQGLLQGHAYAVLKVVTTRKGVRLLQV